MQHFVDKQHVQNGLSIKKSSFHYSYLMHFQIDKIIILLILYAHYL